jgi:hypothetical protein
LPAGIGHDHWNALVIDNASEDGSAALAEGVAQVRLVRNPRNVGFGAAVNQASRMGSAPLLWLLNPDCRVEPGALAPLVAALHAHPACAIAAPQLLNADGSVQASARGEPGALTGLFGRHGLFARLLPRTSVTQRNLRAEALVASGAESAEVDWVMGASMLIRRDRFEEAGGFDERYFLYWEDADLCRRLRDRGYTTRYVPGARVLHPGGVSARTHSAFATREFHKSAYLYYATHVVRSPWHPLRWFARGALAARARWRIARGR